VGGASPSAAEEGSGRRMAEAAASEGMRRRKSRRDWEEAAEADTLRRGEEEMPARGLARRREGRSGLKEAAFRHGACDIFAAESSRCVDKQRYQPLDLQASALTVRNV
jgi:hypothetical protein